MGEVVKIRKRGGKLMATREITRRAFLKVVGALGLAATALSPIPPLKNLKTVRAFGEHTQEKPLYTITKRIPQVCARACEADCAYNVVVGVDELTGLERALTLEGRPEDPVSNGKYCIKGLAFVDSLYDPDRLLVTMKRTNPKKGENEDPGWVVVPSTQAVDEIIEEFKRMERDEIVMCSPGDPHTNRLCKSLGIRRSDQRTECFGTHYYINNLMLNNPPNKVYSSTYTPTHGIWGYDYVDTKYMLWFGFDSFSKAGKAGILNLIAAGRRKGNKIVAFNPIRTPVADDMVDEWYAVKPGTDLAIVLAMAKVILDAGLYQKDYLLEYTDAAALIDLDAQKHIGAEDGSWYVWSKESQSIESINSCKTPALDGGPFSFTLNGKNIRAKTVFQLLKESVVDYTPQWAARISDVPAKDIERIAKEFAQAAPKVCIPCLKRDAAGPNYANSWRLRHGINVLQILAGAIDREGGVLLLHDVKIPWLEDIAPPVKPFPEQPEWSADYRHEFPITEKIYLEKDFSAPGHYGMLGYGLYHTNKIRAIFFRGPYRGLYSLIQPQMVEKVLGRTELVVDWNMYMTDVAYWCDYVIPGGHQFEDTKLDVRQYYPKHACYVGGSPVQKSPGDCIGWGAIATRMGMALAPEYWTTDGSGDPDKVIPSNLGERALQEQGIAGSMKEFIDNGAIWIDKKPYEDKRTIREIAYGRPNGRMRLYIEEFAEVDHECLPKWAPRWTEADGEYKFSTIVTRAPWHIHADPNFLNNPALKPLTQQNYIDCVWIHPDAAAEQGLSEGEWVVLETNPRYMVKEPRPVRAKVHLSTRVGRKDCVLLFHGMGYRIKDLRVAKDLGYRDGDLIPQKNPEIVKKHDPTGMGWVEDVYVRIRKG
jgi:anaerobic selenocysteine-containing dehydrogenase